MTDQKRITFLLSSENEISNSIVVRETATLGVRCDNGKPDVFVLTPTYYDDNERIAIRWDKDEPTKTSWYSSKKKNSYFVHQVIS